ncbi:MAG: hypothetical protein QOD75_3090 [Blastocatellia bacterium]|jgi:hypothetical protein|nr:hypothetical protein [Blastocatellia bacterium]
MRYNIMSLRVFIPKLPLLILAILCLVAVDSRPTADAAPPPCPTVTVSCSRERNDNQEIQFRARLHNMPSGGTPSYHWEVSAGTIMNGQGTRRITVNGQGVGGGNIRATVTVGNTGSDCNPTDDCTTHIAGRTLPNAPPTVNIPVNSFTIVICPPAPSRSDSPVVSLRADASDPDNDTLTYSWSITAGRLRGDGPNVKWDLSGVTPGTYSATVEVSDGRTKGVATATVTVTTCER